MRSFTELPDVQTGPYQINDDFSIVIPVEWDTTNLITDPSFEEGTPNWSVGGAGGCGVLFTSTSFQYAGTKSLLARCSPPPSSPIRLFYGDVTPLSCTSGSTYVASIWFLGSNEGKYYNFYIATTAGVRLNGIQFRTTGFWQRVWFSYKETSTASRRLYVESVTDSNDFYIDAVQFEEIPSGQVALPTTYIDGDQTNYTTSNISVVYYWNGTRHGSTSTRRGGTKNGGRVVNLRDIGFTISNLVGLGLPVPLNTTLPFSQLDGELYQSTKKESRSFSLGGRITARSRSQLDQIFRSITGLVNTDSTADRQPMIMKYQPKDEDGDPIGPEVDIVCVYEGGLEGNRNNFNSEISVATFKQLSPTINSHDEGKSLSGFDQLTNVNYLIKRSQRGVWSKLSTGISGGTTTINAIAEHPNGTIYIGGNFTDAGGSGADYAAIYNPTTDTFSVIKAATTFNAEVNAIAINQGTGRVFFGGSFTNADGIANADGIVEYDPGTNIFNALGTGVSAGTAVFALYVVGEYVYAGGSFLLMNGVANTVRIARWDINATTWAALGTGANGNVRTILALASGIVYIGGEFTLAGGVANTIRIAKWNGAAWTAMGTGANSTVRDMVLSENGTLYIAGLFTTLNGLAIQYLGKWNGSAFSAVGSGTSVTNDVRSIAFDRDGTLYLGGVFINIDGIVYNDGIAKFDGASFTPVDVILPGGSAAIFKLMISRSGSLYLGINSSGTANIPGTTVVTNHGSAIAYPVIIMKSAGTADFRQIINITTGKVIYLDYFTVEGELSIFDFDPINGSFISNVNGNLSPNIMIGSDEGSFFLVPGDNTINILGTLAHTVSIRWKIPFSSIADTIGVI